MRCVRFMIRARWLIPEKAISPQGQVSQSEKSLHGDIDQQSYVIL